MDYEVEKILSKKIYKGEAYYKLKWVGYEEPTWEKCSNVYCEQLISNYERKIRDRCSDEDEDEWEVEAIVDKRIRRGRVQYLVKWRGWPGDPTWEFAENCQCFNLIAAYENPKLRKLWSFKGSNLRLWVGQNQMIDYMKNYLRSHIFKNVNILNFLPNFPKDERPLDLKEGINIGPLMYENHWYLIIILVNHICVTRRILIGDSLNTLVGVIPSAHPVLKRLNKVYTPHFPVKPLPITQMDRSDVCAFYTLAAFERALFLLNPNAQFVIDRICFDASRAELIRSTLKPESDGEISVSLPIPEAYNHGPMCEFCGELFDTSRVRDDHIRKLHIVKKRPSSG